MKKISTLLTLLFVTTLISAQRINISKKGMFIDNVKISLDWKVSDFKKGLGKADHMKSGATWVNRVHYYEKKGIIFWEPTSDSGKVIEMQIFYSDKQGANDSYNKTKRLFSGTITVDNLKLSTSLSATEVANALESWTIEKCYFTNGYKYSNGIVQINFVFNPDETELLWIDMLPVK
ncbi:hypothetical protein ACQ33O_09555 [Ferruginibacter sp. SUN002]|uniref:DUF7738 domain-containing protein n=1 Tax=Ferruginibacter sp. SUN002 TaxID=2937789 RepID=UPI003D361711